MKSFAVNESSLVTKIHIPGPTASRERILLAQSLGHQYGDTSLPHLLATSKFQQFCDSFPNTVTTSTIHPPYPQRRFSSTFAPKTPLYLPPNQYYDAQEPKMPPTLILVRHAEALHNETNKFTHSSPTLLRWGPQPLFNG